MAHWCPRKPFQLRSPSNIESIWTPRLEDAAQVSGTVRDAKGNQVGGAVGFARSEISECDLEVTSDAEGRYVLERAPLGLLDLCAYKQGFGSSSSSSAA